MFGSLPILKNLLWNSRRLLAVGRCLRAASSSSASIPGRLTNIENLPGPTGDWVKELNSEQQTHLMRIREEYHLAKYVEERIPESLTEEDWQTLMEFRSTNNRMRYLYYCDCRQREKEKHAVRKEILRQKGEEQAKLVRRERAQNPHLVYGLGNNTFFMRFNNPAMTSWQESNVAHAMIFGPRIVLDMDWFYGLNPTQMGLTLNQIQQMYAQNKAHPTPCDLIMTGYREEFLDPEDAKINGDHLGIRKTTKSFMELFPKEKLVYLTPDAGEAMSTFDQDTVYIIASLVDKNREEDKHYHKATIGKAKQLGIRTQRFPFEKYVKWYKGSKTMTLNHTLGTLLDVYQHGDWERAIRNNVPKRKLEPSSHEELATANRKYIIEKYRNLSAMLSAR